MSIEQPKTLEEWKKFRFPFDDTPRPGMPGFLPTEKAKAQPDVEDEESEDEEQEGTGSQGGPTLTLAPPVAPPVPSLDLPDPPEPVGTWSYDATRGLIINWTTERMVSLPRHLTTLPMMLRFLAIIEHRHMDHLGFMQALNRACLDIHGQSLRDLIRALPKGSDEPIGWPEPSAEAPMELIAEPLAARRRPGVRG